MVERAPNYEPAHQELGLLAAREGDQRRAVKHFTEALRHNPSSTKSHYQLGLAMMKLDRPKLAVPQFASVLRSSPEHAEARLQMGRALAASDETRARAIPHLKEAVWLRPDWDEPRSELRRLGVAPEDPSTN